jgi:Arc/MetJ family transcription regulator
MVMKIDIDQEKLSQIMTMKQFKSKKDAVNEALCEYLKNHLSHQLFTRGQCPTDQLATAKTRT